VRPALSPGVPPAPEFFNSRINLATRHERAAWSLAKKTQRNPELLEKLKAQLSRYLEWERDVLSKNPNAEWPNYGVAYNVVKMTFGFLEEWSNEEKTEPEVEKSEL